MFTFYTVDTIRYFAKEYHKLGSVPVAESLLADNHLSWCFPKVLWEMPEQYLSSCDDVGN